MKWIFESLCVRKFPARIGDSYPLPQFEPLHHRDVLVPVLFLVQINIAADNFTSIIGLFADDIKIYRPLNDSELGRMNLMDSPTGQHISVVSHKNVIQFTSTANMNISSGCEMRTFLPEMVLVIPVLDVTLRCSSADVTTFHSGMMLYSCVISLFPF